MTRSDYLEFGGAAEAAAIDLAGTVEYLTGIGLGGSYLSKARQAVSDYEKRSFTFEPLNASYCDFCFVKLMGGEYDRLQDGRERCVNCSRSVVKTSDDFTEIFLDVRRNMEAAFGIRLTVAMRVRMVNAKEIARRTGEKFAPTPGWTPESSGLRRRTATATSSTSRTVHPDWPPRGRSLMS